MPISVLGLRTGNEPFPYLFRRDICDFSSQISPLFSLFAKKSLLKKYVLKRHIWKDYEELADDARYTPKYADLYKQRKETIERVFADAKEKHAMRYTPYRGLAQVSNWVRLKFAAMNLKKFAKRKWRDNHPFDFFAFLSLFCFKYTKTPTFTLV